MPELSSFPFHSPNRFETPTILKKLIIAHKRLAELKGIANTLPNQAILINTLGIQEAKDSSAIENIITTHDELFQNDLSPDSALNPATKEVLRYGQALQTGFHHLSKTGLLTNQHLLQIQATLEQNQAGFRQLPGTTLQDGSGTVIYTPPQDAQVILNLMSDLERFINQDELSPLDPLVKMALIHHQFESIHPFYDGNGRTGRILNSLYLVKQGLLDIPVLYLSRHMVRTKATYYRLLQSVRQEDAWEEWILYLLEGVETTSTETISTIRQIQTALLVTKHRIRDLYPSFYSQDLINNLFTHPYTRIEYLERDLKVSRHTATKYLELLTEGGFLLKQKISRSSYYVNKVLSAILTGIETPQTPPP